MAAVLVAGGSLAGCTSTQQKAARVQLNSARIRASREVTKVTVPGAAVAVSGLALVRAGRRTAFVVTVRNAGSSPISDLPISVGYRRAHRKDVYLNAGADLTYFDAHLPAIAGRGTITWIYTASRRVPVGATPFARVGAPPTIAAANDRPPAISTGVSGPVARGVVKVAVRNRSGIPQYQLPVYAVAVRGGRTVAAGTASVKQLDPGVSQTLRVRLLGHAEQAQIRLQAPPTISH